MTDRELFRLLPAARDSIPWMPLAELPTPLHDVEIGTAAQPCRVRIKRDDLAGDPYGGNKVRKLEFLLAHARERGMDRVITAGAFGSHHALATTVYAKQAGLDVTVILFPQRITQHVREILLMIAGLGADIRFTRRMEFVPVALRRVRRSFGGTACIVQPGGSDARGTLGYVECGLELSRQWQEGVAPRPRRIHVAAGTLGTAAGLALGLAIAGERVEISATRITSRLVTNERALCTLIQGAGMLLAQAGLRVPATTDVARTVTFVHDQIGEGYGRETEAATDAARMFAGAGFTLDATYTAKAAAALLADPLTQSGDTLFLNTLSAVQPSAAGAAAHISDLPREIALRLNDDMTTNLSETSHA
jgi:1-aminocyclopropane-1-carboxylate deaminase/D-cysteine desulfhydrase-like pyridoxal-dependent ACC family enzyme